MTPERGAGGLVSVLMPCCGMLEYTRLSVPRVLRHSRQPFEVVFIDAGSLDGTADFLAGVRAAASVRVEVVRGEREDDFAALVEEAIKSARGQFVAWVNNDVLVPEFWLDQLLGLLTSNAVIGLAGPMSNLAPEAQRGPSVPYRLGVPKVGESALDTQEVDRFAAEFREKNKRQWGEAESVAGFCWLARREVLQHVSVFEKGVEEVVFDAGRFSARVRQAGSHLVHCRDLFVHHFGGNLVRE